MHHSIRICDVVTTEIEEGKKTSFIVNSGGGGGGGGGNDSKMLMETHAFEVPFR